MYRSCVNVLLILWLVTLCMGKANYDVKFESLQNLKGEEKTLVEFNFRLIGRDRRINGSFIFHVDLDEQYDVWVDLATFKNGEWIPVNLKVRTKPCDFFKNVVGKYYISILKDSNFPTDGVCPVPKGDYYAKNGVMSTDNWPAFTIKGLNKCSFTFMKDGKLVGGFEVVMNLFERNT
ncbi:uncharacterized protein LOC117890176 [Drosophila subobscura]|uniref:uncharacterized protein LOC117890176 n=1 Tax=Drosophila subobscura TaxID=7241 RepID=UPI00155A44EF|nr:uncharacterized protein LOC117890176 [Drosophila subobscura]